MKNENPDTINEYLNNKYGNEGTDNRSEFNQRAQAFMIGALVKDARKKANLTQEQLAQKVKLKRPHISRIERAQTDIRISTLYKIAKGLGGDLKISFEAKS